MGIDRSSLVEKIERIKRQRNAVILVHNYQPDEVQDIADYLGDSLDLSQKAAQTDADVIVFCGVRFMAETASILCPDKTVLMPDITAGCPLADMITADGLRTLKKKHPQVAVVCYVNTTAEVKAESDICCTSANAVRVVESVETPEIIFVPDKYLARYIADKTEKKLIPWDGFCPIHVNILPEDVLKQKRLHPKAEVMIHPECTPEVITLADGVFSTGGMCSYAKESKAHEIIVGTEIGILHRLRKENPGKKFYPASELAVCPSMKLTSLEKILQSLQDMKHEIKVPENIRIKAKKSLDRMLELGKE